MNNSQDNTKILNNNVRLLYQSARAFGLAVTYLSDIAYLKITLGKHNFYTHCAITPLNLGASIFMCRAKYTTHLLLKKEGFNVPKSVLITTKLYQTCSLNELTASLNFPVVAKPAFRSGRGRNILCNIKNLNALEDYLNHHLTDDNDILVEEFQHNLRDYRVLILDGHVIGVAERFGASVVGDGIHTIAALIDQKNVIRAKLSGHMTISPLCVDEEYLACLAQANLTLQSVPLKGQVVKLCHTANTGRGGDVLSHGTNIHPYNAKRLSEAAHALGIHLVGFDVLCEDIQQPFTHTRWFILEANFNADLTLHEKPYQGPAVNVSKKIIWALIKRYPLSYLYTLFYHRRLFFYFKIATCIIFVSILHRLSI
ncbi:MAG: UDP-N-acetylmuramyl peptide synthase [Legionellaceae bacterium]|nr:UDP-N-acetylmuramyl peptide synthase [Legionellaceae bacterium]HAF87774.1 UDP-N-acetylmuramyl peptide synthase [Legionellales bacterium]